MPKAPAGPLRFGPGGRFELRPAEYRLLVDGQPATLGGRALDLLMALAARPSELHTKSDLLDGVWPGLVVEEGNLRVQINGLRRLLGEDSIATVPGRGYRFTAVLIAQPQAPAAPPAAPAPAAMAAPAQRLFGRDADRARLDGLLRAQPGCVTLVGMPGVGKSSVARAALAAWAGPAAWVDLAPLTQGAQLPAAIARAWSAQLGDGDAATQLLRAVPPGDALLVLDNAEHLVQPCAEWVAQLRNAPQLRVLVTSQLPLALAGEQVLRLEPLPIDDDASDGARALLLSRIAAADSRFQLTPAALPLLDALCRQLDGLPLALEMAAARVPLMGLQAVHDALAERFALLSRGRRDSPARHRSLLGALDWSYGLLEAPEQRLFRALGVFAGGFTLDLAVMLSTDEHVERWDVVDGLAGLVERSLVGVSGEDPPRYRLPETMRAYALGKLAVDEGHSLRRRHAAAMLALFSGVDSEAQSLPEMENAREAVLWAARHDELALAAPLTARVAQAVKFSVWRQEATDWMLALQPALQQPAGQALPLQMQATWWSTLANLLNVRRDRAAKPAARQAVALWRQLADAGELRLALVHWVRAIGEAGPELDQACAELQQAAASGGSTPQIELRVQGALAEAARLRGDSAALLRCREEELRLARELGMQVMAQAAETNVCAALIDLGRHAESAERARALLQRIESADDGPNANLPWALYMLGESLLGLNALAEAQALVPRLLAAERRFGTSMAWQWILPLLVAQGRLATAGRLLGYARRHWTARRDGSDLEEPFRLERVTAAVQARFGAESAAALAAEGRLLDDDAAAALAARQAD